jgi:NAD+ synthase (glutamine-hydrolysing)
MRICISQLNPTIGAIAQNTAKIIAEIKKAKQEGVELIVFPELAICGYFPEDLFFAPDFMEKVEKALEEIIPHTIHISVLVGLPRKALNKADKSLYNSVAVIVDGKLIGYQDKVLLPTYDVFDERRYFRPGTIDKTWDLCGKRVGITICEDIWPFAGIEGQEFYPADPLYFFEKEKVDLLINISASPYTAGKIDRRKELLATISKRFSCPILLCNQVGGQDGLLFDGSSVVFSKEGELLVQAASFTEAHVTFDLDKLQPTAAVSEGYAAELFFALVMGLRDYFVKQGFQKACLGLSGGIDSALVACIATVALGKENVRGILLPSRFTSAASTEDALAIADNLGITTVELSIEKPFTAYLETLHPIFNGKPFDSTEENLQSRIRGMLLMAISNKNGYLVLNTGNKSELAVGYTTLYGDACGAIAVIGDLLKWQVYEISLWIMKSFGWIPERVLTKAPSAELRPDQKDSDSLPEYSILDPIIDEYIVHQKSPEAIAAEYSLPLDLVNDVIRKIYAAEYKRRQCPFALRVSEKAFSYGRKVPIVQNFCKV